MDSEQLCIFGFVREEQRSLSAGSYFNVPEPIVTMILSYYQLTEEFTKWNPQCIRINQIEEATKVSMFDEYDVGTTVYGSVDITEYPHALYRWTFSSIKRIGWIFIGIDSSECEHVEADYTECGNNHEFYSWGMGCKYSRPKGEQEHDCIADWDAADRIIMQVDTRSKTMTFDVSDAKGIVAFTDIDFENDQTYRLAILLGCDGETITLDKFERERLTSDNCD